MERCIGLDMGYGFIKSNDGRDNRVFPSVVGEGSAGSSSLSLGLSKPKDNEGDIRITVGGKTYFIGDLAIRHSRIAHRGLSATRAEGNDIKILFLGALSQFCREPMNDFQVVTGLPPGRMHMADDLAARLKGDHTVVRHQNGTSREYAIRLDSIQVVPQPLGTYWSQVIDSRGQLISDSPMLQGKVGVIDIGFRTSDLATIIDGDYAPAFSRTIPLGISTGYDGISSALATQFGLERETYTLDKSVIAGEINVSGRRVDITDLRDQVFNEVATKLLIEMQSLWQVAEYDHVLITGGGGAALERYLRSHVPQSFLVENSVGANARGYYAWGMLQQLQSQETQGDTQQRQAQPQPQAQRQPQPQAQAQPYRQPQEVEPPRQAQGGQPQSRPTNLVEALAGRERRREDTEG